MMDRLAGSWMKSWQKTFFALPICALLLTLSTTVSAASRPDPELVAVLDSSSNTSTNRTTETTLSAKPTRSTERRQKRVVASDDFSAESTITSNYKPAFRDSHLSFVIPSVVVHGFAIDKDVANQMPRKLDGGQTVVTPGAGLQYVSPAGLLFLGGVLKDCYDDLAGLAQIGQQFRLGKYTSVGYSVGVYMRETPIACTTTVNRLGRKSTTCDEFDSYNLKWMTQINNEWVDIIPMPFLHFTNTLYRGDSFELDFKIISNFALNEFGFSVPF